MAFSFVFHGMATSLTFVLERVVMKHMKGTFCFVAALCNVPSSTYHKAGPTPLWISEYRRCLFMIRNV